MWPAEQFGHDYIFTHTASETAIGHVHCLPHQMMGSIISIFHNTDTKKSMIQLNILKLLYVVNKVVARILEECRCLPSLINMPEYLVEV